MKKRSFVSFGRNSGISEEKHSISEKFLLVQDTSCTLLLRCTFRTCSITCFVSLPQHLASQCTKGVEHLLLTELEYNGKLRPRHTKSECYKVGIFWIICVKTRKKLKKQNTIKNIYYWCTCPKHDPSKHACFLNMWTQESSWVNAFLTYEFACHTLAQRPP